MASLASDGDGRQEAQTLAVRDAYSRSAAAWSAGPEPAYERMAQVAADAFPVPLRGALVLDLGSGSGAAARCLARRGARPVALDPALGMLHRAIADHAAVSPRRLPAIAGQGEALPFTAHAFDGVIAAFSLSHVVSLPGALDEARRVLRPGGALVSATFREEAPHPAKEQVERVARQFGFVHPEWYASARHRGPETGEPARFAAAARRAGFVSVDVTEVRLDTGIDTAEALVGWRLGLAHVAPFVATLTAAQRAGLFAEALAAVGAAPQPWRPAVLISSSRVPA